MSEIHVAVGSYVVDALDDAEREAFQAHLATCESCQREVVEFSETTAQLAGLSEATPPPALRGSILSAIREVRPLPPLEEEASPSQQQASRPVATAATAPTNAEPVIDELAARRNRRPTRVLAFAVAAAMVVALALGGWVVNLVQERQAQVAESALETQLFAAPDLKTKAVRLVNGGQATFVSSKTLNKALFVGGQLPAAGADKKYQLWTIAGATAKPDALLPSGTGQKAWFTGSIDSADGLAVTIEPSTGSTAPTKPILGSAIV